MRLSERLENLIGMVLPCETAADIGTDHGFVPIELCRRGIAARALACDVRPGPLERAAAHVARAELSGRVCCRLGNGLLPVEPGEADCVIIAGMGGTLMAEILEAGKDRLEAVKQLILSPHTDADMVRKKLSELGFRIRDEKMVLEEDKYYVILRAEPGEPGGASELREEDMIFGPVLLQTRPELFLRYLGKENEKLDSILKILRKERPTPSIEGRIREAEEKQKRIRRVLFDKTDAL